MRLLPEFFAFARERQRIYLRRKAGEAPPWTEDPILRAWRFCNVYRENDRTTIWIRRNIRDQFSDHPNLWLMLAICRMINRIETLEELLPTIAFPHHEIWRPANLVAALEKRAARGDTVYTSAYMIRSDPGSKHHYIGEIAIGGLWNYSHVLARSFSEFLTLEDCWMVLQGQEFVGWGPFMAYELVTDLRHTRYQRNAIDVMTWASAGPGASRGLARVVYADVDRAWSLGPKGQAAMLPLMQGILAASRDSVYWPKNLGPNWEMREVEHTLCEFDKHQRALHGQRLKRKYVQD